MSAILKSPAIRLVLLAALGSNVGCALRVKVKEDWDAAKKNEVPLHEAAVTWQQISRGQMPGSEQLRKYNEAVRNSVVQIGANWSAGDRPLSQLKTSAGDVMLELLADEVLTHQEIDQVVPADFVRVKRGFESEALVDGVGASLIIRQPRTERNQMIPESGLWFPVTAFLNLDHPSKPVLHFVDPTRQRNLPGRSQLPLSANYTASFARDFHDRQQLIPDVKAMIKFEKYADRMGLHRVSSFDPDKQVCILIHGINSSPSTWEVTINEFYRDPELRERFEFWTFGYPTGALIPYLSAELRDSIYEMQEFRRSEGARDRSMIVVGHSMGGLLAKSITQRGGDEDWNRLFKVPIEDLRVSPEYRETLRRMIYFEPVPGIEKVIFCSTPHRGSRIAAKPGGKLIGSLIQVPVSLAQAGTEILNDAERSLTPLGWQIAKSNISSVSQLRPGSPISEGYLNKPLNPSVRYYSVIGSKSSFSDGIPVEDTTDGVVAYPSAHIDGVEEEIVVYDVPHGVHREPDGIAEISRLLKSP